MQEKLETDDADFGGLDDGRAANSHRVVSPVDRTPPEFETSPEHQEFRGAVERLPNGRVEQAGMIGKA